MESVKVSDYWIALPHRIELMVPSTFSCSISRAEVDGIRSRRKMQIRMVHFICVLLCISGTHAAAEDGIIITDAWSRATTPGAATAVVYLKVVNRSKLAITLDGIETPVATRAHIHKTVSTDGLAKMIPIDNLPLAPGEQAEFGPGGLHVMLMGLRQPLLEGETFPIKVIFVQNPPRNIEVRVGSIGQMHAP